jgi:hypothetical protein
VDRADVSFWLSIAGFATSSVLGLIKLVEFAGSRRIKLKAEASLISIPEMGNTIRVHNASSIPVTISYFELSWIEQKKFLRISIPFWWKEVGTDSPIDPPDNHKALILSHQSIDLDFSDQYHFDWGASLKEAIYLKVWIVGRNKPFWLYVTGPGSR